MKEDNRCELGANGFWRPVARRYTVLMVGLHEAGHWVCGCVEALINLGFVEATVPRKRMRRSSMRAYYRKFRTPGR